MFSNTEQSIPFSTFLKKTLTPFSWYFCGFLIVAIFWAVDASLKPYLIKIILDRVASTPRLQIMDALLLPVTAYLSIALLLIAVFRFYEILKLHMMPRLKAITIQFMMDHMMGHSHSYYQKQFSGALASKINDVVMGLREIIQLGFECFFTHMLATIFAIFTVSTVRPILGILLTIWVCIFIGITIGVSNKSHKLSGQLSETNSTLMGQIVDILTNMAIVRFFTGFLTEKHQLGETLRENIKKEKNLNWFLLKVWGAQGLSFVVMEGTCLYFLLKGYHEGSVSIGDFALIFTINIQIVEGLWRISQNFSNFSEHLGRITQGLRVTTANHDITNHPEAKPLYLSKGEICFENVFFQYPSAEPFFENKSVSIPGGQRVGLVGYSGSGKSTFINLILQLFEVQKGRILIDGQDLSRITQESLWQAITVVPQDSILFHRTLMENIRYGRIDATDEEVMAAAHKAYADEFIKDSPQGYSSLVGERGIKLSGGQRQRIAIARAILKNSPILIFDEATSALDSLTEAVIQKNLLSLMENKTTLVIAHRLSTLLYMDRILVFDRGKIIEDGSHDELMSNNGLYHTMWNTQSGGFLPLKPYNEKNL